MVTKEELDNEIHNLIEELVRINHNAIFEFPFQAYLSYLEKDAYFAQGRSFTGGLNR